MRNSRGERLRRPNDKRQQAITRMVKRSMEAKTREKLREWSNGLYKLDEKTKAEEAEVWCLSALSILEQDVDFQKYLKAEHLEGITE